MDLLVVLPLMALVLEGRWVVTRSQNFRRAWQRSLVTPRPEGLDPLEVSRSLLEGFGAEVVVEAGSGPGAYRPGDRTIVFAPDLVAAPGLGALAVVVHEVGHTIQHHDRSPFLTLNLVLRSVAPVLFGLGLVLGVIGCLDGSGIEIAWGESFAQAAFLMGAVVGACERNASARGLALLIQRVSIDPDVADDLRSLFETAVGSYLGLPLLALPVVGGIVGEAIDAEREDHAPAGRFPEAVGRSVYRARAVEGG